MTAPSDDEIALVTSDLAALVAGGRALEEAVDRLRHYGVSSELLELARARFELGLVDASGAAVIVDPERSRKLWYAGPQDDDIFWPPMRARLRQELDEDAVEQVDKVTTSTLALMSRPGAAGFSTRGLVLGHVQSGKTTNFMALAAKAADRGYRMIVILSGVTDILRDQTQDRVDRTLVGDSTSWYSLTRIGADFAETSNPQPLFVNFQGALIAVVKKNPARLRRLRDWLRSAGTTALKHAPLLLIDDEADQASIDVGKDRVSVINGLLRQILEHPKSAYVAYTATPFANLLIDPSVDGDLYPRDFIVSMPRPREYFGAEELFGRPDDPEDNGLGVIRSVPTPEAALARPPAGQSVLDGWAPGVGAELRRAILWFLLSTTARRRRAAGAPADDRGPRHSTMLIHTSMLSEAHFRTREAVAEVVDDLEARLDTGDPALRAEALAFYESETQRVRAEIFGHDLVPFTDVWSGLPDTVQQLEVIVDNYRSEDRLSYSSERERTAIVIGGNTLSRGLTLIGLCSSYFIRSASAYDTLLQMGRWFGYRRGYEDLCRVWMTDELARWFSDLSRVESEIREEIATYAREALTPIQLGVRIRLHPDLEITAAAKMRSAVNASLSFSGRSPQTTVFARLDSDVLSGNANATKSFLDSLARHGAERCDFAGGRTLKQTLRGFREVPVDLVLRFIQQFRFHPDQSSMTAALLDSYIRRELLGGSLSTWRVVVMEGPAGEAVELPGIGEVRSVIRSRVTGTADEVAAIRALMSAEDRIAGIDWEPGEVPPSGDELQELRSARHGGQAILRIYPVDRRSAAPSGSATRQDLDAVETVFGLAFDFPESTHPDDPIGYVVAPVTGAIEIEADEDVARADEADESAASTDKEAGESA